MRGMLLLTPRSAFFVSPSRRTFTGRFKGAGSPSPHTGWTSIPSGSPDTLPAASPFRDNHQNRRCCRPDFLPRQLDSEPRVVSNPYGLRSSRKSLDMPVPYGPAIAIILRVHLTAAGELPPSLAHRVQLLVEAARAEGVDPVDVVGLCVMESGLRYRARRASLCGCQPYNTDDRAQARCAARSYAAGLVRCGTPEGAVSRYVWGRCSLSRGTTERRRWWRDHVIVYTRSWSRIVATMRDTHPGIAYNR